MTKSIRARIGSSYPPNGSIRTACPVCLLSETTFGKSTTLKREPKSLSITVMHDGMPPVEIGAKLTKPQYDAWCIWFQQCINGENVKFDLPLVIPVAQWDRLMNDREFALAPMNSVEFRKTLAGRLPPNERRRIVRLAGLTLVQAFMLPFPEVVNLARQSVLKKKANNHADDLDRLSVEVGPFELQWLGIIVGNVDRRTVKKAFPNSLRSEGQRKWYVTRRALDKFGDWKTSLRVASATMPQHAKIRIERLLSLH